jgi:hypothetical protein
MEVTMLFVAVGALILLAVTSMRYGVESRDGFAAPDRELTARRIVARYCPMRVWRPAMTNMGQPHQNTSNSRFTDELSIIRM